jgi:integrase
VTVVAAFVAKMGTAAYRREVQLRNGQDATATTGYAVETIKSILIPLSRTFAYAKRHLGYAGENIVTTLDLDERPGYKKHKAKKKKYGRDEIDRLIEAAEAPWREIIGTGTGLGTRIGETLGIRWKDIDFDDEVVTIAQQANAKREIARLKTETAQRRIEAPTWLITMFREQKLRSTFCEDDDLVFCTITGKPHGHGNVLARGLYAAQDRAGLPRASFHSLRHSHASLWIKEGGDIITLSKRLGHSTHQVTMTTYADEIEEVNDRSARMAHLDRIFGGTGMARQFGTPRMEIVS